MVQYSSIVVTLTNETKNERKKLLQYTRNFNITQAQIRYEPLTIKHHCHAITKQASESHINKELSTRSGPDFDDSHQRRTSGLEHYHTTFETFRAGSIKTLAYILSP